jgi:hypothetical protein
MGTLFLDLGSHFKDNARDTFSHKHILAPSLAVFHVDGDNHVATGAMGAH